VTDIENVMCFGSVECAAFRVTTHLEKPGNAKVLRETGKKVEEKSGEI